MNRNLLFTTIALVISGLIVLSSASVAKSWEIFGSAFYFLNHQLILGVGIGTLGFIAAVLFPYQNYKKLALPILIGTLVLLFLVLVPPFGLAHGGARRWLALGPISFQPSEIAKVSLVLYLAAWLEARREKIQDIQHSLLPFLTIMGLIGFLILIQPDISTLGIIVTTAAVVFFAAGGKGTHLALIALLGIITLSSVISLSPEKLSRIQSFLNPRADPQGESYQISQSLIALGSGGILGRGLGYGQHKLNFLPEPHTDAIFAVIGEELGLGGCLVFLGLYLNYIYQGLKIARRAPDDFGRFLAVGLTSLVGIQVFVNLGAVTGLVPFTGVTLPFISYGGTSMAVLLTSTGILLNVSKGRS